MKIHHAHMAVRITVEWPPTAWRHKEPRATAALFEFAKVQQCLRVTFMMLENIMGPEMGSGCPDRGKLPGRERPHDSRRGEVVF
jgi:hypothetical protein